MAFSSSNAQDSAPEISDARPLVVAISHGFLRQWVVSELVAVWQGRVEIVDGPSAILRALQGHDPVLLICGQLLSSLTQDHWRRWTGLASEVTVVLVESLERMELINSQLAQIDAVLLWELHQGVAIEIVRSAKSGIRAFPPEVVDRLISGREEMAARQPREDRTGSFGRSRGSAPDGPAAEGEADTTAAPPASSAQDAAPGRPEKAVFSRLIRGAIARIRRTRGRTTERE